MLINAKKIYIYKIKILCDLRLLTTIELKSRGKMPFFKAFEMSRNRMLWSVKFRLTYLISTVTSRPLWLSRLNKYVSFSLVGSLISILLIRSKFGFTVINCISLYSLRSCASSELLNYKYIYN